MDITKIMMLRPVYSAPHLLAGEKVLLTVFDRIAVDLFVPTVIAYPTPAPSNEALKEGLLKAVAPYPYLAGRLAVDLLGRRFLHLNNEGVLVIEATVPVNLAEVLVDGHLATSVKDLYPPIPEGNIGAALLQIQLNRYKCGGLVIGMICHHHVADGHSMSTFLATWASAVRQGKHFVAPSPFLDRATTAVPRSKLAPVFDHRTLEFTGGEATACAIFPVECIKNVTVHFTADFIAELKARVGARCSTFQCLLAHAWKSLTAARGLNLEEYTKVKVSVNCRGRANPPVDMDFFGNMVLRAVLRLQVRDVLSWGYVKVVRAIQDAVARINDEYIQSFVDFATFKDAANGEEPAATAAAATVLCPDMEAESFLGFSFHLINFGSGPPTAFLTPDIPIEGVMIFMPSCNVNGAVVLMTAVAEEHAATFEQMCYSLD